MEVRNKIIFFIQLFVYFFLLIHCLHLKFVSGHLYLQLMKEKMELWLTTLKQSIMKKAKSTTSPQSFELNPHLMEDCLRHTIHLERMFENFLGKLY